MSSSSARPVWWAATPSTRSRWPKWSSSEPGVMPLSRPMVRRVSPNTPCSTRIVLIAGTIASVRV
jgi:hypothetical protein